MGTAGTKQAAREIETERIFEAGSLRTAASAVLGIGVARDVIICYPSIGKVACRVDAHAVDDGEGIR
jgi:hypothetical protein